MYYRLTLVFKKDTEDGLFEPEPDYQDKDGSRIWSSSVDGESDWKFKQSSLSSLNYASNGDWIGVHFRDGDLEKGQKTSITSIESCTAYGRYRRDPTYKLASPFKLPDGTSACCMFYTPNGYWNVEDSKYGSYRDAFQKVQVNKADEKLVADQAFHFEFAVAIRIEYVDVNIKITRHFGYDPGLCVQRSC